MSGAVMSFALYRLGLAGLRLMWWAPNECVDADHLCIRSLFFFVVFFNSSSSFLGCCCCCCYCILCATLARVAFALQKTICVKNLNTDRFHIFTSIENILLMILLLFGIWGPRQKENVFGHLL